MESHVRLRWAIFTTSVVSAIDNPDAYLWRELGSQLRAMNHEALFFEPRGNEALRALLQQSGARPLKAFHSRYPDIEYRTLEPRTGADLVDWMSRTLATVDVAAIQSNTSPDLINWLGKLTRPHLQTYYLESGWNPAVLPSDQLIEQLDSFTAVVVGNNDLAEKYTKFLPANRVLRIGPLPEIGPGETPSASASAELRAACQRLIEEVTASKLEATKLRRTPVNPNGYRN